MKDKIMAVDRKLIAAAVIVAFLVFSVLVAGRNGDTTKTNTESASAQEADREDGVEEGSENVEPEEAAQSEDNQATSESSIVYEYVAQAGDSHTEIARKAIQTYGIVNDVNLSPAQIIYAETSLTQAADSPVLDLGQQVSIEESAVREVIEKAAELSEAAEVLWAVYVVRVDFNTDHVGEAHQ